MGRRTDRWIADDGQEFSSELEMVTHELLIFDEKMIEAFLSESTGEDTVKPRKRKEYKRILLAWQEYNRANGITVQVNKPISPAEIPGTFADSKEQIGNRAWAPTPMPIDENGDFLYTPEEEQRQIDKSLT